MRSVIRRALVVAGAAVMVLGPVAGVAAAPAASAAPVTCLVLGAGFRPFTSLQAAVNAAHAGDTLLVVGTCRGNTDINKYLTVTGLPGATLTAGGTGTVLGIGIDARATLNTLTITNGSAFIGGGIYNSGIVTLNGSTVTGNSASKFGGGIFNAGGTVTLNRSTVTGNSASLASLDGGGIRNDEGTLTLNGSTVTRNTGGGIVNDAGTVILTGSSITGNIAAFGGGIWTLFGAVTLNYGSRITGNTASSDGGGIENDEGTITLKYGSRISGNTASGDGGGIFDVKGAVSGAAAANITGNAPDNCAPPGSVPGCVG